MRLQIKTKQTKRSFESLLIKLTLYYDKANPTIREMGGKRFEFDNHIGTWQKAGAWYNKPEKEANA